jgi:hypothetical protein
LASNPARARLREVEKEICQEQELYEMNEVSKVRTVFDGAVVSQTPLRVTTR